MGFPRALQRMENDPDSPLKVWQQASFEYSKECSLYTKIRLMSEYPNASDEDIVRHAKAHKRYKVACKVYAAARVAFVQATRTLKLAAPQLSDEEYLILYGDTSIRAINEQRKKEEILNSIPEKQLEDARKVMAMSLSTKERFLASGMELDEFIASDTPAPVNKKDPTEWDDAPLPESSVKESGND